MSGSDQSNAPVNAEDCSAIPEAALQPERMRRATLSEEEAIRLKAEIARDIQALDAYEAKHGSFSQMAAEYFGTWNFLGEP